MDNKIHFRISNKKLVVWCCQESKKSSVNIYHTAKKLNQITVKKTKKHKKRLLMFTLMVAHSIINILSPLTFSISNFIEKLKLINF